MGIRGPRIPPIRTRLEGYLVSDTVDLIVNAALLALIGQRLHTVISHLSAQTGVGVATRLAWFFIVP